MPKLKNSFHPYAWVTIIFWALGFVFTRLAVRYFSPFPLGCLRYLAASATLILVALATKMKRPARKDLPWLILSGACGFFLYMLAFNLGSVSVPAATGSVVMATTPVLTALLARLFYKERLLFVQYLAIGLSFFGVVVLTVLRGGFSFGGGLPWLMAGVLLLSVYNLLQRRLTKTYSALQATAYSIFFGTIMLCVFLPGAITEVRQAPAIQIVYILGLGILSSALAYCTWSKAFSMAKNTSSVTNYMFVTPFITTLMGMAMAGESPDLSTVAGGLIIIAGLLLFGFGGKLRDKLKTRETAAPAGKK